MDKLYYSIGEVSSMLDVKPSVLRFWETEFDCLKPVKTSRGTRNYTAHDIEILRRIHFLTRECGYTLEGAREQMRNRPVDDPKMEVINNLTTLHTFLTDLKASI